MKNTQAEKIKDMYLKSNHLFTFTGTKYILNFYSNHNQTLSKTNSKLKIHAKLIGDTYYLLVDEGLFLDSLKDNKSALYELEKMLAYKNGLSGYFFYGLCLFLIFIIFFGFSWPIDLASYMFYQGPFWLQITGVIALCFIFLTTSIWLLKRVRNHQVRSVNHAGRVLHFIKDKTFRVHLKHVKKQEKSSRSWLENKELLTLFSPFHRFNVKVIVAYFATIMILFIVMFMGFFMTKTPLKLVPLVYENIYRTDPSLISVVKSRYEFSEKIDPITDPFGFNACDAFYCQISGNIILDSELNPIDFTPYLQPNEDLGKVVMVTGNLAVVIIRNTIDSEAYYKVIDLLDEVILYTIDEAFMNLDVETYHFYRWLYHDGFLYTIGTEIYSDDSYLRTIYKMDETGVVDTYYFQDGRPTSKIIHNNNIYVMITNKDNPYESKLLIMDLDFSIIDEITYQVTDLLFVNQLDNVIIFESSTHFFDNAYYYLNDQHEIEGTLRFLSLDIYGPYTAYFNDALIVSYGNLKGYLEFDAQFNRLNRGLDCKECTFEEYFSYYSFIKTENNLYALSYDHTLVFTQIDGFNYTLSRSIMSQFGFMLYLGLFFIPTVSLHIFLKKKEVTYLNIKAYLETI